MHSGEYGCLGTVSSYELNGTELTALVTTCTPKQAVGSGNQYKSFHQGPTDLEGFLCSFMSDIRDKLLDVLMIE